MLEVTGDLWEYHKTNWCIITTNGVVNSKGECVMGRGVAYQAKIKFPGLATKIGNHIKVRGNVPGIFADCRLITLPVKRKWDEAADIRLIERGLGFLWEKLHVWHFPLYMPRPGCGNGNLDWTTQVRPIVARLPDRFVVVHRG